MTRVFELLQTNVCAASLAGPNTKLSGLQKPSTIVFSRAIGLRKVLHRLQSNITGSVTGSMILKRRELPARPAMSSA